MGTTTNIQVAQREVYSAPVTQKDGTSNLKKFNQTLARVDVQQHIQTVVRSHAEQFVNNISALVSNDVKLQGCTPISLINAGLKATALGLPLDSNLGFAYVIPYNNTKKVVEKQLIAQGEGVAPREEEVTVTYSLKEAQFQLGYRGFIQLALRTGQFKSINVTDVRDGEVRGLNLITGDIDIQAIDARIDKPVVGYVAYFALTNGFSKMLYMTVEEIRKHASTYSQTYSSSKAWIKSASKWSTDFDAMAKKTVLKLLLSRYAPLSVEMMGAQQLREAVRCDQSVIDEQGNPDYVDGTTDEQRAAAALEAKKEDMRESGVKPSELF